MSSQSTDSRQRRKSVLLSAVVLVALTAVAVAVIPMLGSQSQSVSPAGPPVSGSPSASATSPTPSSTAAKPTRGTTSKSSGTPTKKATRSATSKATSGQKSASKDKSGPNSKNTPKGKVEKKSPESGSDDESGHASPGKSYNGRGKVPSVRSNRRTMDKSTAEKVVGTYVRALPKIDPTTKKVKDVVGDIAGAAVQQELANRLAELKANGWSLSGEPTIKSSKIVSKHLKASPPSVTVKVCLDSSSVVTLDHDGKRVGSVAPAPPAYNLYGLEQQADGSWLLVSHTFPANPTC